MVQWRRAGPGISAGLLDIDPGFVSVDGQSVVRRHQGEGIMWEHMLDPSHAVHARPLAIGEYVIVADSRGVVHALDKTDGALQWSRDVRAPVYTAMAGRQGRIYVPTTRGKLFALASTSGEVLWHYARSDTTVRLAPPVVDWSEVRMV